MCICLLKKVRLLQFCAVAALADRYGIYLGSKPFSLFIRHVMWQIPLYTETVSMNYD